MSAAGYGQAGTRSQQAALDVVRRAVARVLDVDVASVSPATQLDPEAGVDSLAYVEIIEVVEIDAAGLVGRPVRIDDGSFGELCSVGEVAAHIAARFEGENT